MNKFSISSFHTSVFLLAALLLSSCNLFIEEEEDLLNDGTLAVPIHSGQGYDEPVTEEVDGCTLTYQFNSDVRIITEDDLNRYVLNTTSVLDGALIVIDYSAQTPRDKLPVPGEILLCAIVGEKFPYGCNHRVERRIYEDGVYKCVCSFAKLDETYTTLNIDGELEFKPEYFELDESQSRAYTQGVDMTRADNNKDREEGFFDADKGFGLFYYTPFFHSFDFPDFSLTVDGKMENNYIEIINHFHFSGFNLSNKKFKMVFSSDVKNEIDVECSKSTGILAKNLPKQAQTVMSFPIIKGKVIPLGQLIIVLFLDFKLDVEAAMAASFKATRHSKSTTTYSVDLDNFTVEKKEMVDIDEPWKFEVESISGSIGLVATLDIGFGLYGKILSLKVSPILWAGIKANMPFTKKTLTFSQQGKKDITDLTDPPTVDFITEFSIKVGVVLDLSLKALLGESAAKTVEKAEDVQALLDKVEKVSESDGYEGLDKKEQRVAADDVRKGENKEIGVSHTFGPWEIKPLSIHNTFYPKIEDKTFKHNRYMNGEGGDAKASFTCEYKIEDDGFSSIWKDYTPAILLVLGDLVIQRVYPVEGGENAVATDGKKYHFNLPVFGNDKVYMAYPCYYYKGELVGIDKPLPYCPTSPMVKVINVGPDKVRVETAQGQAKPNEKYCYMFTAATTVKVEGTENIIDWGVFDGKNLNEDKQPVRKTSSQFKIWEDGTYTATWEVWKYTDEADPAKVSVEFFFYPFFYMDGNYYQGNPSSALVMKADRTYYYKSSPDIPYSYAPPMTTWSGSTVTGKHIGYGCFDNGTSEGRTVARLRSIEKDDETVW